MFTIYEIVNKVTGFKYIGCSKDYRRRWKEHLKDLNNNKHHNSYLQRAWNKYGEGSFEFTVAIQYDCEDIMFLNEKLLIEEGENLYNVAPGGLGGDKTKYWTEERRKEFAELKKQQTIERLTDPEERKKCNVFTNLSEEERKERLEVWSECKKGSGNGRYKYDKPVKQLDKKTGELIKTYKDLCDAVEQTGFERRNILNCLKKKKGFLSAKGYRWEWE